MVHVNYSDINLLLTLVEQFSVSSLMRICNLPYFNLWSLCNCKHWGVIVSRFETLRLRYTKCWYDDGYEMLWWCNNLVHSSSSSSSSANHFFMALPYHSCLGGHCTKMEEGGTRSLRPESVDESNVIHTGATPGGPSDPQPARLVHSPPSGKNRCRRSRVDGSLSHLPWMDCTIQVGTVEGKALNGERKP